MDTLSIKAPQWMDAVPIKITESIKAKKGDKIKFKATVLFWDEDLDKQWSITSRNKVRYHRESSLETFKRTIAQNNGIPVMYNHIMDGDDADQLGLINKVYDDDSGLVVEGILNGNKTRVLEEIVPGFLNNVSLQVDGDKEQVDENGTDVTYARPSDAYEVSFVPVNGVTGANAIELALVEAVRIGNKRLIEQAKTGKDLTKSDIEEELKNIESCHDLTEERYDEMYKEALDEVELDQGQLGIGMETEMEHRGTYDWLVSKFKKGDEMPSLEEFSKMITKEHLREIPDYYTRLRKMETEAKEK